MPSASKAGMDKMERVQGKVGGFGRVGNTRVSGLDWLVLGNNTWVKGCFYF